MEVAFYPWGTTRLAKPSGATKNHEESHPTPPIDAKLHAVQQSDCLLPDGPFEKHSSIYTCVEISPYNCVLGTCQMYIYTWISKNLRISTLIPMIFGYQSSIIHKSVDVNNFIQTGISMLGHSIRKQ